MAGLESGADDYLTKPFDPEELKARLRTGTRILDLEDRLIEAREEMRFQATHDALTSLWNRGVIMELLGREPKGFAKPFPSAQWKLRRALYLFP